MANLDTRSKRASGVQAFKPFLVSTVTPDGTLSAGDRQHVVWMYAGIGAQVVTVTAEDLADTYDVLTLASDIYDLVTRAEVYDVVTEAAEVYDE